MNNITIIEIPDIDNFHYEIRNEITNFFDKYNIYLHNSKYSEFHTTYISLFKFDIHNALNSTTKTNVIDFRIVGATRGGIHLLETKRDKYNAGEKEVTVIYYTITGVEFISSTCFEKFNTYTKDIIDNSNKELLGKILIIKIYK